MRKIIIALIASTGVLSGCSDFLGTDPDNDMRAVEEEVDRDLIRQAVMA